MFGWAKLLAPQRNNSYPLHLKAEPLKECSAFSLQELRLSLAGTYSLLTEVGRNRF